jgi:hypothetical protein
MMMLEVFFDAYGLVQYEFIPVVHIVNKENALNSSVTSGVQ